MDRDDSHEIAFVFGQLSSPDSVPSLIDVLRRPHEEDMVRHEAAEALGGIATGECLPVLKEFAEREDVPRVVRESCVVALDMVCSFLRFLSFFRSEVFTCVSVKLTANIADTRKLSCSTNTRTRTSLSRCRPFLPPPPHPHDEPRSWLQRPRTGSFSVGIRASRLSDRGLGLSLPPSPFSPCRVAFSVLIRRIAIFLFSLTMCS